MRAVRPAAWRYSLCLIGVGTFAARGCKEKHKGEKSESVAALLTRAAEEGDEEAISLLAAGALEGEFEN